MRRVRGFDGKAFLVSDPLAFHAEALSDVGDGFDWRMRDPSKRLWVPEAPLVFEAAAVGSDEWVQIEPLEVSHLTGRVGFARCLRSQRVRASGTCRPTALVAVSVSWDLRVMLEIADTTTLMDEAATNAPASERSASCVLEQCTVEPFLMGGLATADTLVHLPYRNRVFAGLGAAKTADTTTRSVEALAVDLHEGKVSHVRQ